MNRHSADSLTRCSTRVAPGRTGLLTVATLLAGFGAASLPAQGWDPIGMRPPTGAPVHQPARLPDPRFRPALGVWEIDRVACMVARASGERIRGDIVVAHDGSVPFAGIRGPLDGGQVVIHPRAAREVPPNSWAFIIGHEFAHRILDRAGPMWGSPELESQADILGARYAVAAGFDLAAHIAWTLSRPNGGSPTHGALHQRATVLGRNFGIPPEAVRANLRRYGVR